jgi:hypothetical protein
MGIPDSVLYTTSLLTEFEAFLKSIKRWCTLSFYSQFFSSIWRMQNMWSVVGLLRRNKYINKYRTLKGTVSYILFSWTWKHVYCQRRHLVLQLIPRLSLGSVICTGSQDARFFRSHIFRFVIRLGHSPFRPSRSRTGVWTLLFADWWWAERNADLQAPSLRLCADHLLNSNVSYYIFLDFHKSQPNERLIWVQKPEGRSLFEERFKYLVYET